MIRNRCPDDEYDSMHGYRSSVVKLAWSDARKFQAAVLPTIKDAALRPVAAKKSDALTFGTIVHERILLKKRPLYCPHSDKRTKEYKTWIASLTSTSSTATNGDDCSESVLPPSEKCEPCSETTGGKEKHSSKPQSTGSTPSTRKKSKSQ